MSQKHPNKMNGPVVNSASPGIANLASADFATFDQENLIEDLNESLAFRTRAYHELLENPHIEVDGLQRLEENLARLEDLHGRLHFLMRDIAGLLKNRS
jgi:hypothetical protein